MSQNHLPILELSYVAAGTIAAKRVVNVSRTAAGAADISYGVNDFAVTSGQTGKVSVYGTAIVEAGAAISAGARVQATTGGKVITQTSTNPVVGILAPGESAAADGDFVEIILTPNCNL